MIKNITRKNMKYFVGSFSIGKDSTLAIYKAMCEGMVPLGFVITYNADVCGENGEYHTMVTDGPTFNYPFTWEFGEPVFDGRYAKLPLL